MKNLSFTLFKAAALAALTLAIPTLPATAKSKEEKEAKKAQWKPVGEPVNCIMPSRIRSTHVWDDQTIDFKMNGGDVYRNTLPYRCSSLGFEQRFSYKLSTSQLCSVDIISVLHSYGGGLQQGASCGLGKFQKVEQVKEAGK